MTDLDRPIDVSVSEIYRGQLRRGTVRTRLPRPIDSMFLPAPLLPFHAETLTAVRETATRCAPWLRCYAGPRLWALDEGHQDLSAFPDRARLADGRGIHRISGQAWTDIDVVLVLMCAGTAAVLSTLHHEIWHAVEARLSDESRAVVDRAWAEGGREYPGVYLASPIERRARLYQHWASAMDEGYSAVTINGQLAQDLERVFWYVWSGQLALDVATQEAAASQPQKVSWLKRAASRI